ncbi:MAG: hypothetical protein HZY75_06665 [Nocardioidaceae bacterium]|nr:MAG: hypothetical protein HZY75_06665 [Nocardioidaceae bacterium]
MLILRATKKLRDKVCGVPAGPDDASTTVLGDWYANLLAWRRPHVILVNARTLVPVITPLAPARSLAERLPDVIADALVALGVAQSVVDAEREHPREVRIGPTVDRSVVGSMNDFIFLAGNRRDDAGGLDALDLGELSKRLAHVPCGPLYKSHTFPDAELHAFLASLADGGEAQPET